LQKQSSYAQRCEKRVGAVSSRGTDFRIIQASKGASLLNPSLASLRLGFGLTSLPSPRYGLIELQSERKTNGFRVLVVAVQRCVDIQCTDRD